MKALASLYIRTHLPEPSLLADAVSIKISSTCLYTCLMNSSIVSMGEIFRILPKFGILRQKVSLKMLNLADYYIFIDLYLIYIKKIDHLNFKVLILYMYTASFKIRFDFLNAR